MTIRMIGILIGLGLLCGLVQAQETTLRDRRLSQEVALERIREALGNLDPVVERDAEGAELLAAVRKAAKKLELHLAAKPQPPQILLQVRIIDLDAKGAAAAWETRFGALPEGLTTISSHKASGFQNLPGLPSAPQVMVNSGQSAELTIGEDRDCSYLRRKEGEVFVVERTKVRDGLTMGLRAELLEDGSVENEVKLSVYRIIGKTELSPDSQTVGLPLLSIQSGESRFRGKFGDFLAWRLPSEEGRGIIAVLHNALVSPGGR